MKSVCIVGSLTSIFTHSYINSLLSSGYNVLIINTSKKLKYEKYKNCEILNLNETNDSKLSVRSKSKLKDSKFFCYLYEVYLFFRAFFSSNAKINSFLHGREVDHFIFFWGTSIRKEFYNIKKLYNKKNTVPDYILDVATYPVRDYAIRSTPGYLLWFDKLFFNSFNKILSHSNVMDEFLIKKLAVNKNIVERFVCSFPKSSYYNKKEFREGYSLRKIIFLGTLDSSSSINNISSDILKLADSGIQVYIQKSQDADFKHPNVKTFEPFSFEQIINGELSKFCIGFDGILVAYGPMSKLREDLTYPTRYALALLQNLPIFVQYGRFTSLVEIISQDMKKQVIYYKEINDILNYSIEKFDVSGDINDCMENKLKNLFDKDFALNEH